MSPYTFKPVPDEDAYEVLRDTVHLGRVVAVQVQVTVTRATRATLSLKREWRFQHLDGRLSHHTHKTRRMAADMLARAVDAQRVAAAVSASEVSRGRYTS